MAIRDDIATITDDLGYTLKRGTAWVAGKSAIGSATEILKGFFSGQATSIATFIGMGLISAFSAALVQMDYLHKKDRIKEFYRDELGAKLKKSPDGVTEADLDRLAKGDKRNGVVPNQTMREELKQLNEERFLGMGVSVIASLATLAIVNAFTGAGAFDWAHGGIMMEGVGIVAKGMMGLGFYNAIKKPLKWLGHKLFDLDDDSVHDRIVKIAHERGAGKQVTREQVFEVFVEANPSIEQYVIESYGKPFENLPELVRGQAIDALAGQIQLDRLTRGINNGDIRVSELAFAVEGQRSGVAPGHRENKTGEQSMLSAAWHRLVNTFGGWRKTTPAPPSPPVLAGAAGTQTAAAALEKSIEAGVPDDVLTSETQTVRGGFVERLGLAPAATHQEQARATVSWTAMVRS